MSLLDLKKRIAARKSAERPDPAPLEESAPAMPAVLELRVPAVEEAPEEAAPLATLEEAPVPDPIRAIVSGWLARGQELLIAGLADWHEPAWLEALLSRTRGVVAIDPDARRLGAARPYCRQVIAAAIDDASWCRKLGDQRFGAVLVGPALGRVADPVACLRLLASMLVPEGFLLVVLPNAAHAEARLQLMQGELPPLSATGGPSTPFTRARARELFACAGFAIAEAQSLTQPAFSGGSQLVPELFPDWLLRMVGQEEDALASHFVFKLTPQRSEAIVRDLIGEYEALRRTVRNELAKTARTHDALNRRLEEADLQRDELRTTLEEAQRSIASWTETAQRAEHNVRRLEAEADGARRALVAMEDNFWVKLGKLFSKKSAAAAEENGPSLWKYEETRPRY